MDPQSRSSRLPIHFPMPRVLRNSLACRIEKLVQTKDTSSFPVAHFGAYGRMPGWDHCLRQGGGSPPHGRTEARFRRLTNRKEHFYVCFAQGPLETENTWLVLFFLLLCCFRFNFPPSKNQVPKPRILSVLSCRAFPSPLVSGSSTFELDFFGKRSQMLTTSPRAFAVTDPWKVLCNMACTQVRSARATTASYFLTSSEASGVNLNRASWVVQTARAS